jgi:hypothetical protein
MAWWTSSACGAQKAGTVDVSAGSLSHFRAEMQVSGFWRVL